jgi:uncharacterized BrkB/YihY/UPF0761 family membrane protein
MYQFIISIHNIARWIVIIAAFYALFRAYRGWFGKRSWTETDRKAGLYFSIAFDVQFLLGLILTVVSPLARSTISSFQNAMTIDELRLIAEHIPLMLAALILVHVTSVFAKRTGEDVIKHRRAAIGYTLAFLVMILGTPWARPFLPGLG